jgi:hypothetical protein
MARAERVCRDDCGSRRRLDRDRGQDSIDEVRGHRWTCPACNRFELASEGQRGLDRRRRCISWQLVVAKGSSTGVHRPSSLRSISARSRRSPRCSWVLTVPSGRPVSCAISSRDRSAKKRSATISRYGSASLATVARTVADRSARSASAAGSPVAALTSPAGWLATGSANVPWESTQATVRRRAAWRSAIRTAIRASHAPNGPSARHVCSDRYAITNASCAASSASCRPPRMRSHARTTLGPSCSTRIRKASRSPARTRWTTNDASRSMERVAARSVTVFSMAVPRASLSARRALTVSAAVLRVAIQRVLLRSTDSPSTSPRQPPA